MADKRMVGVNLGKGDVTVEMGRLRLFAKVTGQQSPLYLNEDAASRDGHRSLPVPPTFLMCLNSDVTAACGIDRMKVLQLDLGRVLHAEQAFDYYRLAYAGDRLSFATTLADVYDKKGRALHFVVLTTRITNQDGDHVADLRSTLVERRT